MPHDLACCGAQRDDRVRVAVLSYAQTPEVVGARAARRQKDEPVRVVDDDLRPRVGAACRRVRREGMERPPERTGRSVERADLARRHPRAAVVGDERSDDHEIAVHRRRRAHAVLAPVLRSAPEPLGQIDLSVAPESLAALSALTLEADEACVDGRDVETIAAQREPAARELAVAGVLADIELDPPRLGARVGVERDHGAARRREIEAAVRVDRRGFERGAFRSARQRIDRLAGVVGPRDGQPADVARGDGLACRLGRCRKSSHHGKRGEQTSRAIHVAEDAGEASGVPQIALKAVPLLWSHTPMA